MPEIAPWTLLSPEAPLHIVGGATLLVSPAHPRLDEVVVLHVDDQRYPLRIRHGHLGSAQKERRSESLPHRRLIEFCSESMNLWIDHALVVPGVLWPRRTAPFGPRNATAIHHPGEPGKLYDPSHLVAQLDALPTPEGARPRDASGSASAIAQERVDTVKSTYGELRSDIVYRIENSALFDHSAPLTQEFQLLLMRWDDEARRLGASEAERLAMEIRLAFDAAREHAEAVGLTHLPATARADAGRAIKAAHLARSATSEGERAAAMTQVIRLLGSIALYYLPTGDEAPTMIGGSAPQLEGQL